MAVSLLLPQLIAPISVHMLARKHLVAAGIQVPDRRAVIDTVTECVLPGSRDRALKPTTTRRSTQMRAVVITGTSTGIGRASALALDRLGFHVFAGVRKEADGESLRSVASERLRPVHLDVTDEESIFAAGALVAESVGDAGLAGLVNNAGTTVPCPVEYLPLEAFRRQLDLHLIGPLALTKTLLPLLKAGRGRILNVTSVGGRVGVPFMAPYAAGKHGLEGMSDVLRLELRPQGVQVCVIEPGSVSTTMRAQART